MTTAGLIAAPKGRGRGPWDGATVLAFPMHGQGKLLREGYRTRDGHVIEWLGRRHGGVTVLSRPEPVPAVLLDRLSRLRGTGSPAPGTSAVEPLSWRVPDLRDRRRWWCDSVADYPLLPPSVDRRPALVWNPFAALARPGATPFTGRRRVVLDLLDDWSRHYAFEGVRDEVEEAYSAAFARADVVTANGRGTAELARRHGRDDVVFLPNGCDPERFDGSSTATGPTTVGYVGKIGRRLDLEGVLACVTALPGVSFVFAGPVLDAEYRVLDERPNVTMLGDVHYERVPALLRTFDVGWVPHHVGDREVGGDVIKTYEYRAAGLPVLSTPICGIDERGLDGVIVADVREHAERLRHLTADGERVPRRSTTLPAGTTWLEKVQVLEDALGLHRPTP